MKKVILSLALCAISVAASAASITGISPTLVGSEANGASIYVGISSNTNACLNGGVYFTGATIAERKGVLAVAMAAKLAGKTVRIDFTQAGGPGTICLGSGIYIE